MPAVSQSPERKAPAGNVNLAGSQAGQPVPLSLRQAEKGIQNSFHELLSWDLAFPDMLDTITIPMYK